MYFYFIKKLRHSFTYLSFSFLSLLNVLAAYQENYWPIFVENTHETIDEKKRLNFLGPFAEEAHFCSNKSYGTVRPFWIQFSDDNLGTKDTHILYPLINVRESPELERWNFLNILEWSRVCVGERNVDQYVRILPLYVLRRTGNPETSYEGLFPLGGSIRNFWGVCATWSWFPFYVRIDRGDVSRHGLLFPFIRWQEGPGAGGGALWPIVGYFYKENSYRSSYFLWPLIYRQEEDLDQPIPSIKYGFLPFYAYHNSKDKCSQAVLWPFFKHIESYKPRYTEFHFPWPLFVQARGENHYINRWVPVYSHSVINDVEKKWFMWPLVRQKTWKESNLRIDQQQFCFFLIWTQRQYRADCPSAPVAQKTHLWPVYSYWDNASGQKQFQLFSPFEPLFPTNRVVQRLYTPIFALYRFRQDMPGYTRHSFLFDLVSLERTPERSQFNLAFLFDVECCPNYSRVQILKGLLGIEKKNGKKALRFFWLTI